jgi:hypothetical protein
MDDEERYRRGAGARRKILGDAWVDRADANRNGLHLPIGTAYHDA